MVRDLVVQAQNGDRDAFAALVQMTSDRMYALAARILRDNDLAEDALQGALITVWRQLPTLRDPDRFEAWVRRLLVHACYAEARRRRSWSANVRVLPVDGPAAPDALLSIDDRDALDRAFRRLTDRATGGLRAASPRRAPIDRDRRRRRHPGRDSPFATPLCDAGTARGRRGRRGAGRPRRADGMTSERDFDRLARAWLDLGPDEAPDRVVAAVLQAAETTPQVRRPIRWPFWRSTDMNRLPVAAGAVAVLVVVIGGGILLDRGNQSGGIVGPAPTPTATPIPSPSEGAGQATPLPAGLTPSSWVTGANAFGYPRLTVGRPSGPDGLATISLTDGGTDKVLGSASSTSADLVQVAAIAAGVCDPTEVGTYDFALSADRTALTVTPSGVDPCADRAAIARTWTRSLVGQVTGGTGTIELTGQVLRLSVPEGTGWVTNGHDTVFEMYDESTSRALRVWIDPQGFVDPCDRNRGVFAVGNAAGFVAYLAQNRAIRVDRSTATTVDGRAATHVVFTTTASPSDGPECTDTALEIWPSWNEPLGSVAEQWVVDLGRHWVVIEIETGLTGSARDAEFSSIIDSIRFIDLPS